MAYRSNVQSVRRLMDRAVDAGLIAGGQQIVNRVKLGLRGGYAGGEFVTGNVMNSVTVTKLDGDGPKPYTRDGGGMGPKEMTPIAEPIRVNGGARLVIGTNVGYALPWEVGFVPARGVFSPGVGTSTAGPIAMRRKEVWRPAAEQGAAPARAAFQRAYDRVMTSGRHPPPITPPGAPMDMAAD